MIGRAGFIIHPIVPQIIGPEVPIPSDGSAHRLATSQRGTYVVPDLDDVLPLADSDDVAFTILDDVVVRIPRSAKLEHAVVGVAVAGDGTLEVVACFHERIVASAGHHSTAWEGFIRNKPKPLSAKDLGSPGCPPCQNGRAPVTRMMSRST